MKSRIETVCSSCEGSGLYEGFCEAKGEPVICLMCEGSGCEIVEYTPFTCRRKIRGVKAVHRSRGTFIATGVGKMSEKPMSYAEFLKKPSW